MSTVGANNQDWVCKFQFFDRDAGQWSAMLSPQIGFGETFVQDETTDDGSLNFKWRSSTRPNIKHMQWARILHFHKGDNMVATYDEDGLPLNHNQYVIGDFQMAQSKDKSYWLVKLSLLEPIERMRFVVGETLAYTNQTSKTVTDGSGNTVTYVKDPYNHLTALERFLKVTPANCDNYDEGYNPHNNKSWYNRIKILDKEFLQNIPFDSDSFTEPDLYIILFKYDKSTGRTPCMYFDMDPETDLPRNLNRDEYILKFLRQDGFDKPVLNLADISANAQNVTYKSSLSNFATGVVSNVENLVTGSNLAFPSVNFWAAPELNSTQRDTTATNTPDSGWGIRFPFPIKKVNKIKLMKLFARDRNYVSSIRRYQIGGAEKDNLEKYCYEEQEYLTLSEEDKANMIELYHYTEGDDFLYIYNYYYTSSGGRGTNSYLYYVEFEPLQNSKLELGNNEYTTVFNQVDAQVELKKYTQFLNKYQKSMNKSDLTIIKKHYHPDDMYEVGSLVIDEETGKNYMITGSSYQNLNRELLAVYQLNENHFRRNNSVKANKAIRSNIKIPYDNLKDRKTCFKYDLNFTYDSYKVQPISIELKKILCNALTTYNYERTISQVLLKIESKLKKDNNTTIDFLRYVKVPVNYFTSESQLILNFTLNGNAVAGQKMTMNSDYRRSNVPGGEELPDLYHTGLIKSQVPIIYTDPFVEIQKLSLYYCFVSVDFSLYMNPNGDASSGDNEVVWAEDSSQSGATDEYYHVVDNLEMICNGAEASEALYNNVKESVIRIENICYLKDALEKINISTIYDFHSDWDFVICENFIKLAGINSSINPKYQIHFEDQNVFSENDIKDFTPTLSATLTDTVCDKYIEFNLSGIPDGKKAAVIYYAERTKNNVIMIINNIDVNQQNNNLKFYF